MTHLRRLVALAAVVLVGCSACSGTGSSDTSPSPTTTSSRSAPDSPTTTPMPTFDPSSRVGELAPGFPEATIPVPPGATIVASSATTKNGVTTATLNLKSNESAADLATFYDKALTKEGFATIPNKTTSALTSMATYRRQEKGKAEETIVVGVFDDNSYRLVTISGTVNS